MFWRVPGTRPNISESHSEISTRVPVCRIHGTLKGKHPVLDYKKLAAKRSMCTGDLTGDGALDVLDLLELLKLFGSTYKNIACGKC